MEIDLHPQSTDIRSNTLDHESKERPIRPGPDSDGTKTSIIMELPRKTANYYKDFKQIEKALLVDDYDGENNIVLLTNLNDEPSTYKQAVQGPYKREWLSSMKDEIDKLEAQFCWDTVDLPEGKKVLGGRWVYKLKTNA